MSCPLYVSSGAFIGRRNGFSPDGFLSVCREYDCDGFEFMAYRAWYPELDEMIARALADVRGLMRLPKEPRLAHVLRTPAGIPQAEDGYLRLLEWRERLAASEPRLHLLGFGWQGIGINEMIREAKKLALRLAAGAAPADAPLKGIYV